MSGETARAHEVMANFNYVINVIGELVGPDRLQTLKEFLMGGNSGVLLSAASQHFVQLGWNVDLNHIGGGVFEFARLVPDKNATALRIGKDGVEIMETSTTSGDLNRQLSTVWAVRATTGKDFMYFAPGWSIQNKDGAATKVEDYRLLYTPFTTPKVIYTNKSFGATVQNIPVTQYDVPSGAQAVKLSVRFKAGGSEAETRFFPSGLSSRPLNSAVSVIAASGERVGGVVDVNLVASKFSMEVIGNISEAYVTILGYYQ
jgi:hypothetical protein